MDPLRVEVVGPDQEPAPVRQDARPFGSVADDGDLAERGRRPDHARLVHLHAHRLEALVEVEAVLCRVEDAADLGVAGRVVVDHLAGRHAPALADDARAGEGAAARRDLDDRRRELRCVRLFPVAPPGRNSVTSPSTSTASPRVTAGRSLREHEEALRGRRIAVRVRILEEEAVRDEGCDDPGDVRDRLALERRAMGGALDLVDAPHGPDGRERPGEVVAIVSGGSSASWSDTCAPAIVVVHVSPSAKSTSGFRVNVVGPPLSTAVWVPLSAQEIVNHAPATFTGSLNVTDRSAEGETPIAPDVGEVAVTCGAASATTVECAPRPVKSSVAKPSHSIAGSNAPAEWCRRPRSSPSGAACCRRCW